MWRRAIKSIDIAALGKPAPSIIARGLLLNEVSAKINPAVRVAVLDCGDKAWLLSSGKKDCAPKHLGDKTRIPQTYYKRN
jgi:hypothetical protein